MGHKIPIGQKTPATILWSISTFVAWPETEETMAKANSPTKAKESAVKKKKSSPTKHLIGSKKQASSGSSATVGIASGAVLTILNKAAAMKSLGQGVLERKKLSALTGIHGKSTIANALTKIKAHDWMVVTPQTVEITEMGLQVVDTDAVQQAIGDIPTTNAQFLQSIKDQHKLKGKQVELMNYIQDGKRYEKEDVASAIGLKMNSTFSNLLTTLKKLDIIEFDRKTIRLTDKMLPFEPRAEWTLTKTMW